MMTSTARRSSSGGAAPRREGRPPAELGASGGRGAGPGPPASRRRRSCSRQASATSPSPTRGASCTPGTTTSGRSSNGSSTHQPAGFAGHHGLRPGGRRRLHRALRGTVPESAIASMAPNGFVFSLANPTPEVDPEMAAPHAAVVATGRSDLPNQINNVLAFPGIFCGAIDARAHRDHRGDEAGRGRPPSPTWSATRCGPTTRPQPARPPGRRGGRRRRGRLRPRAERHRARPVDLAQHPRQQPLGDRPGQRGRPGRAPAPCARGADRRRRRRPPAARRPPRR